MAIHARHHYFGRNRFMSLVKAVFALLGLAILGYVAIAGQHAAGLPNVISRHALDNRMSDRAPQVTTGGISATELTANSPRHDVDYFPNGYVNQATKIEDPIASF